MSPGFALPYSEFGIFGLLFLILGIAFWTIGRFWPETKRIVAAPQVETAHAVTTERPDGQVTGPVTAFVRTITWPTLIDPDAGDLTDGERRVIIDGLALVADAWCAQILTKAFDEETGPLRVEAIDALAHCESDLVPPTLERAYASHVITERYAAVEGAARRTDIPLLERALRDTDPTIALAAAYGLHRAHRDDLVDAALTTREDARANEIRRVLPILAHL